MGKEQAIADRPPHGERQLLAPDDAAREGVLPGPAYDRSRTTPGVVHIGVGGFHRAHQARYHDRLLAAGGAGEWAICGVGVLAGDRAMRDALGAQDGLYTLVERDGHGGEQAAVVGSLVEYLLLSDDREGVLERMASPATRIVSLTITEGGYGEDADPTAFELIAEALERRRAAGTPAFTVMSCDNLAGNGALAREGVLRAARARDAGLATWVEAEVRFPASAVDRITPATTPEDREHLAEAYGVDDAWPVVCEPFTWWVLEDSFGAGRPRYEDVGVQMVDDVAPYEEAKLRLLNAGHQVLAYFGFLLGHEFAHEAAGDSVLRELLDGYLEHEATPAVPPVPGFDLAGYRDALGERFANPALRDPIARLCVDGSDRIPGFLLPVIRDGLSAGRPVDRAAAAVAAWARYAEGVDEHGDSYEVADRRAATLVPRARSQRDHLDAFVEDRELFGDLADHDAFMDPYRRTLRSLHERGARAALSSPNPEPA